MAKGKLHTVPTGRGKAPGVNPDLKSSVDRSYDPAQHGSVPLETVSVKKNEERSVWPVIWAGTTILMILATIYFFIGD